MNMLINIFGQKLYLRELLFLVCCYLLAEGIFSWLLIPNSSVYALYTRILSIAITGFTIFQFRYLDKTEKVFIAVFTALLLKLLFESLLIYQQIFKQFSIFTVIYPVVFTVFIKLLLRRYNVDLLGFIAKFYLFTYIVFMILFGRQFSFGLEMIEMKDYGPFSGDSRIIHARSIFMMIIPLLWYLNSYLLTRKISSLGWFVLCCVIILVHQHRSVWSCSFCNRSVFSIYIGQYKNCFFRMVEIAPGAGAFNFTYLFLCC